MRGNEYFPVMIIVAIIITLFAFVTAIVAIVAAKEVIWDEKKPGWNKFNKRGYIVIICGVLMVFLPLIQFYFQNQLDEQKEANHTIQEAKHDSTLRAEYRISVSQIRREYQASESQIRGEYQRSVLQIRKDYSSGNNQTLTVIGKTLAEYKLRLDTSERRVSQLIKDSANRTTVLPDQPVLMVLDGNRSLGLKFLKTEQGLNYYTISFVSKDGGSCCYNLKISAVIEDSSDDAIYKGPVRVGLAPTDNLPKDGTTGWPFTIDDNIKYNRLVLWIRGTYSNRDDSHVYHFDEMIYNLKLNNYGGDFVGVTKNQIIKFIEQNENK